MMMIQTFSYSDSYYFQPDDDGVLQHLMAFLTLQECRQVVEFLLLVPLHPRRRKLGHQCH